ncbi:ankyrin repeat-containing protein BDA1-like [Quercus lobata]|uniref:ankyrin repeat-containing protein BDA1-like n=1 Tax=Quercus lobata TaxID=97700 RepID=UPI0012459213|nr:ankyrin repeat-containing protein BDA1-like [Quercus lobata]
MDEIFKRMKQVSESGDIDAFYILIREDVNLLDHIDKIPFVDTPLHIATSAGHIQFSLEMMGLKPSFARKRNLDGFSPIHLALQNGHIKLVRRLIQADGNLVRVKGREWLTPLHFVVAKGDDLDLLDEFLLICPDSLTDVTIQNETALHIALKYDKLDTFKLLVGWLGSNWSEKASFYERAILNWKDDEGNTILHIAVSKNETQAVKHLLDWSYNIVNLNVKNLEGKTAWDILQGQTHVDNSKIRDMLRRDRAKSGSSLSTVHCCENYLRSPFSRVVGSLVKSWARLITALSDEKRNALLVVAVLLVTVTYQAVLSPPGGIWQDDTNTCNNTHEGSRNPRTNYQIELNSTTTQKAGSGHPGINDRTQFYTTVVHPAGSTQLRTDNETQCNATATHIAGTAISLEGKMFSFFLIFNSLTFMFSNIMIWLLVPVGEIGFLLVALTLGLCACYLGSLTVITKNATMPASFILPVMEVCFYPIAICFAYQIRTHMVQFRRLQDSTLRGLQIQSWEKI